MNDSFDFDMSPAGLRARAERAVGDVTGRVAERVVGRMAQLPDRKSVV